MDCLGESSVTTRMLRSWGRSEEEGDVRMESERRDVATSQGMLAAIRSQEGGVGRFSSEPLKEFSSPDTLILDVRSPDCDR